MPIRTPQKPNTVFHALDKDIRNPSGGANTSSSATNQVSRQSFEAAEEIDANKAFRVVAGLAYKSDYTTSANKPAHFISLNFAEAGATVIAYNPGEVAECDTGLSGYVLLGADGALIDEIANPSGKTLQRLGNVTNTGEFVVNIDSPYIVL